MSMTRKPQVLTVDMSAPLPLGYHEALRRAVELRDADPVVFTWQTIAAVIRIYHGFDRSSNWWRRSLRGRVASRSRGGSFTGAEGLAA